MTVCLFPIDLLVGKLLNFNYFTFINAFLYLDEWLFSEFLFRHVRVHRKSHKTEFRESHLEMILDRDETENVGNPLVLMKKASYF